MFLLVLLAWTIAGSQPATAVGLFPAVERGDVAAVQDLVAHGASVNEPGALGRTPVFFAVSFLHVEMVSALCDLGADVTIRDAEGTGPVHVIGMLPAEPWATKSRILQMLLARGASLEDRNADGMTLLLLAGQFGNLSAFEGLIDSGSRLSAVDDWGQGIAHRVAQASPFPDLAPSEKMKIIAEANALLLQQKDVTGRSPLFFAARQGHVAVVEMLVRQGGDTSATDVFGCSALQFALQGTPLDGSHLNSPKLVKVIELLIGAGIDVNHQDGRGLTALHYAAALGDVSAVKTLVEAGARVDQPAKDGRTPLHWAACADRVSVGRVLLELGATADSRTRNGLSPLECAQRRGANHFVTWLQTRDERNSP